MATVARMVEQKPFRWIAGWQAARSIEGTDGQHLRVAFSDDGRKWTQSYPLPVGRNQVRLALALRPRVIRWAPGTGLSRLGRL